VEQQLQAGMTEIDACKLMDEYLRGRGVRQYFHEPFAWFDERTAFAGDFSPRDFAPTDRKLEAGMPVILDVAPAQEGYPSDIGYAFVHGENPVVDRMLADLEPHRALILEGVRAGRTMQQIYRDVDALIAEQGYENRHQAYPGNALGHRVGKLGDDPETVQPYGGFGPAALVFLITEAQTSKDDPSHAGPVWNGSDACDHPIGTGLWAVEPHLGKDAVGVKWEEILVVPEEGEAYWLDDDLPHVRRWRK
jgi:Xaa-Pro aminopeptidase